MFFDMEVGFPPREEQDRIERVAAEKTQSIEHAVQAVNAEIDKLNELRSVIISEAVTGKIKL
jgi:type I restriction enzyme, S subunit